MHDVDKDLLEGVVKSDTWLIANAIVNGANPNTRIYGHEQDHLFSDFTMLHAAVVSARDSCVSISALVDARANVNAEDMLGASPLFYACWINDLSAASMLLSFGANPNITCSNDEAGNFDVTPLHAAVLNQNLILVHELLNNGADPNATCMLMTGAASSGLLQAGIRPLHLAAKAEKHSEDLMSALVSFGAESTKGRGIPHALMGYYSDTITRRLGEGKL